MASDKQQDDDVDLMADMNERDKEDLSDALDDSRSDESRHDDKKSM